MSGQIPITIVGNAVADPELRWTPSGVAVASLRVASNPRRFDRQSNEWVDGDPLFLAAVCWKTHAENVVETVHRGDRVIVTGHLVQKQYEAKDGSGKRSSYEIADAEVAVSLLRATARIDRNTPAVGNGGQQQRPAQQGGGWGTATGATTATAPDPWATQGTTEPPF